MLLSCSSTGELEDREDIVTEKDLEHLLHLLEGKDGQKEWQCMMERSTSNMRYQAWRHEPQVDSNYVSLLKLSEINNFVVFIQQPYCNYIFFGYHCCMLELLIMELMDIAT
jgi:hypothetical protein